MNCIVTMDPTLFERTGILRNEAAEDCDTLVKTHIRTYFITSTYLVRRNVNSSVILITTTIILEQRNEKQRTVVGNKFYYLGCKFVKYCFQIDILECCVDLIEIGF